MKEGDLFITVYADLDLAYKITNELEYEASRFSMVRMIEEKIAERFTYWKFESEEGHRTFIIKTQKKFRRSAEIVRCYKCIRSGSIYNPGDC